MSIPGVVESFQRSAVLTDLSQMSEFRAMVRECRAQRPAGAADHEDVSLVATELITNAFLHGAAREVTATLTDGIDGSEIEVVHDISDSIEVHIPDSIAEGVAPGGRGLAIVRAITDDVVVEHRDGRLRVVARWLPQH